jgi:hypothetical protein
VGALYEEAAKRIKSINFVTSPQYGLDSRWYGPSPVEKYFIVYFQIFETTTLVRLARITIIPRVTFL